MASAGRVLIIPRGAWTAETEYGMLDLVTHNEKAWVSRGKNIGEEPAEGSAYWQGLIMLPIANNLTTEIEGYLLDASQGKVLSDELEQLNETLTTLGKYVTELGNLINNNTTAISTNADSIKGIRSEITEINSKIDALPTITSGTSEPSGGEDGDVYIMYE